MKRIDNLTIELNRVKSVAHALRLARLFFGRGPRCGYEMTVDESKAHRTTLVNEGGRLRVWTWFNGAHARYDSKGYLFGRHIDYVDGSRPVHCNRCDF